jgi:hypothetical protein
VAVEADLEGRREAFEAFADVGVDRLAEARFDLSQLLGTAPAELPPVTAEMAPEREEVVPEPLRVEHIGDAEPSIDFIRRRATRLKERLMLQDGRKNWPMEKIFRSEFLQGANEIWLLDPFLSQRHQRRNVQDFVNVVAPAARAKTIHIVTKPSDGGLAATDAFFSDLDRQAYEATGTRITVTFEPDMHDRFVIGDNGIVFKLGRGLDIYKPSVGLASRNAALRSVRSCEIDIFGPEEERTETTEKAR